MIARPGPERSLRAASIAVVRWLLALMIATAAAPATPDDPAPGAAEAQVDDARDRVALTPIVITGATQIELQGELERALVQGLRRAGFAVVTLDASFADCSPGAPECLARVREAHGATHLLTTRVESRERDYSVTLELVATAPARRESISQSDECSLCGLEEVRTMLIVQGPQLRSQLDVTRKQARLEQERQRRLDEQRDALARQPVLVVRSEPAGALVTVDGERVGFTPLERKSTAGSHLVTIELEGYAPEERTVTLERGVEQLLELTLTSGRLPPTAFSRQLLISGSVSLSLGVAALGVMGSGLSLGVAAEREGERLVAEGLAAGNTGIGLTDALADTRRRGAQANTMAIAGGVVAGVLLTTGATLIGLSTTNRIRRITDTVRFAAGPSGARGVSVSLSGRF